MKRNIILPAALILTALSTLITLILLPSLPSPITTRWDFDGNPESTGSKYILIVTALIPVLAVWLISRSPAIHPEGSEFQKHRYAYGISMSFFLMFLIAVHWIIILFNLGMVLPIALLIKLLIGVVLIITGALLPGIPYGHSVGIRTPWSADNRNNWERTHRFARILFITAGVIFMAISPAPGRLSFWVGTAAIIVTVFSLYYYSYRISREDS